MIAVSQSFSLSPSLSIELHAILVGLSLLLNHDTDYLYFWINAVFLIHVLGSHTVKERAKYLIIYFFLFKKSLSKFLTISINMSSNYCHVFYGFFLSIRKTQINKDFFLKEIIKSKLFFTSPINGNVSIFFLSTFYSF
jgi:hypothetical protein